MQVGCFPVISANQIAADEKHSLFWDQMEAHLPEELVLFQHYHGNRIHLSPVKVKVHTRRRIP